MAIFCFFLHYFFLMIHAQRSRPTHTTYQTALRYRFLACIHLSKQEILYCSVNWTECHLLFYLIICKNNCNDNFQ